MAIHPLHPNQPSLELGFLTPHNPHDRHAFSGTAFFAARALAARSKINLRILGSHRPVRTLGKLLKRKSPEVDAAKIEIEGLDAIIGLVATPLLDQMITRHPGLPFLHVTDATPAFLRDAYGWRIPADADATETRVAARAAKVVYSSDKMAGRAPDDLGLPGLVADAVPFGVNFERLPGTISAKPSLNRLNLLFVGIDWERKGGDIAVAVLDRLNAMSLNAHLTIIGRCPERHRSHPNITYGGFLNKNRPREADQLSKLYQNAHFLLLPSRADCTPMVIGEAMAHGTPVLATDTGGIASQIGGDGTGRLLPPFASPELWAGKIAEIAGNPEDYHFMSEACSDRGQRILSWENWAMAIEDLARQVVVQTPERDLKTAISA